MSANVDRVKVRILLETLEDPFEIFPLQSVADSLDELIETNNVDLASRQGDYGVARKFWDVESEHLYAKVGLLLGAAFVLGQTAITQTASILSRLRQVCDPALFLPASREAVLQLEAPIDAATGLNGLVIIDTAANYFKHYHEWPDHWIDGADGEVSKPQRRTIENARRIGMCSTDVTDNLYCAFDRTCGGGRGAAGIPNMIQEWRERLASRLGPVLGLEEY